MRAKPEFLPSIFSLGYRKSAGRGASFELKLLTLDGDRVQHQETLFKFAGRPYEPAVAPDGSIYIVTDSPRQLLRLTTTAERRL